ncbi:ATP-binding cassette domain-containing protein [Ferrimonas pelagia]
MMVIRCEGLEKYYGGALRLKADLTINAKRTYLTGENGSGKSTLLRLLAGIEQPDRGVSHHSQASARIVLSSDSVVIPEVLNGWELVELFERHRQLDRLGFERHADALGLKEHLSKPFGALSTGNQRKLNVLLALCCPADLYALDEPFNGLDSASLDYIKGLLFGLEAPLLLVDHTRALAAECDEIQLETVGA